MLGYVCKYTPMELFEAMDTEITRLEPSVTDFNHAGHPDARQHLFLYQGCAGRCDGT